MHSNVQKSCGSSRGIASAPRQFASPLTVRKATRTVRSNVLLDSATVPMTYAALGLSASSFVGLFFVAPRFSQAFKAGEAWPQMYDYLVQNGTVKPVTPAEAAARTRRGAVLVDVRLADKFKAAHAEGSVSVPLFQPIQEWDLPSILRRMGFAFFGVYGTEINPNFEDELRAAVPRGKEIVLMCERGGSLENKQGTKTGFESRSLKAAYYCLSAGYNKVSYVGGGIDQWNREGLELVDEE